MKRVLVVYATAHESTKGVAEAIAERLASAGLQSELRAIGEVQSIAKYDAVVVGSAIHNGRWLPRAAAFIQGRTSDLAMRPVWLFSVSSVGETSSFFGARVSAWMRRMRQETPELASFRAAVRARDHRHFAGAIHRGDWSRIGDLFLRVFGGRHGDHRDWRDIEAWAARIAEQVRALEPAEMSDQTRRGGMPAPSARA